MVRVASGGSPRLVGKPVSPSSRLSGIIMESQRGSSVRLDTVRGLVRRTVRMCLGPQGELAAHRLYHRFLRRIDRFSLPESRGNLAALALVSRQSNTILDIGANVGRYAWFFAQHARKGISVYAFEPMPSAFALLEANMSRVPDVTCLPVALGDGDGPVTLHVPLDSFGNMITGLSWASSGEPRGNQVATEVALASLDYLVKTGRVIVRSPMFMKIDVEGFEYRVLSGARQVLRDYRPVIYFECQSWALDRIHSQARSVWTLLGDAGYDVFAATDGVFDVHDNADREIVTYFAVPMSSKSPRQQRVTEEEFAILLTRVMAEAP